MRAIQPHDKEEARMDFKLLLGIVAAAIAAHTSAQAEQTRYVLDPDHTYPSFEADHFNGASVWRGKFNKTSGAVALDPQAGQGSVEVIVDMGSVNTGSQALDQELLTAQFFDTAKFPTAIYKSRQVIFENGAPKRVEGDLTLHGVTKPVTLEIRSFKCYDNPIVKKQVCGTDATATFDRADFGVDFAKDYGFSMKTTLQIQAEGVKE
jgi:polyisoprenoid-binding protein YceI